MPLEFSAQSKQQVARLLSRYPTKQAALLPVLHLAQEEFGHLPDEAIELVSRTLDVSPAHIFGVITFYTMFHREKPGRNELMVCTNISCMLRGAEELVAHVEGKLGIKTGESTPDGRIFLKCEEECLAACANAPMMICGEKYFLDLTPAKVDAALDDLRRRWKETQQGTAADARTLIGMGPGGKV